MIRNIWPIRVMLYLFSFVYSSKLIIYIIKSSKVILTKLQSWPHPSRWYFCCTYSLQNLMTQLFYLYCHSDIFAILITLKFYILFEIRTLLYSFININIFLFFIFIFTIFSLFFLFTIFSLFFLTHFNKTTHNIH